MMRPETTPGDSVPAALLDVVTRHLPLLASDATLQADDDLRALGLTSLEMVAVLVDIETTHDVTIPDHLVGPAAFRTPASLWDAVRQVAPADRWA